MKQSMACEKWWWYLRISYIKQLAGRGKGTIGDETVKQVRIDTNIYAFVVGTVSRIIPSRVLCFIGLHNYRVNYPGAGSSDLLKCTECGTWVRSIRRLMDMQ